MIEPEMAFADLTDDMDVIGAAIKYVINYVLETCPQDMEFATSLWIRAFWTGCAMWPAPISSGQLHGRGEGSGAPQR